MICDTKVVITTFAIPDMTAKILYILTILSCQSLFSQGLKVLISEEKTGRRVELLAENKTTDTLNVLLTVNAEGYRRSSLKPIVRDIPPLKRVPMITLIELDGVESRYTFDLVVNEPGSEKLFEETSPERDIERVLANQLVIFTTENCTKCDRLIETLEQNHIQHRLFTVEEDALIYRQFMSYVERRLTSETKIRFPVIWIKEDVIFGYDDVEEIIGLLDE